MGGLILSEFNIDNVFKVGIFADLTSLNPPSCSSGRRRLAGSCIQFRFRQHPQNIYISELQNVLPVQSGTNLPHKIMRSLKSVPV